MDTGLFLLRQIDPKPALLRQLEDIGHAYQFDDGTVWVDDDLMRDSAMNQEITGWEPSRGAAWIPGCTIGWGIFSHGPADTPVRQATYSRLDRAQRALALAVPRIVTEFDLDEEDAVSPKAVTRGRRPFDPTVVTETLQQ